MTDYQYGLSNIQDNHILQQVISKRRKICESILDNQSSKYFQHSTNNIFYFILEFTVFDG